MKGSNPSMPSYLEVPTPGPGFSDPAYGYPIERGRRNSFRSQLCEQPTSAFPAGSETSHTFVTHPGQQRMSRFSGRHMKKFSSSGCEKEFLGAPLFQLQPINIGTKVETNFNQLNSTVPMGLNMNIPPPHPGLRYPCFPPPAQVMSNPVVQGFPFTLPPPVWTEHFTLDGKPYYYNVITRGSTWLKPPELTTLQNMQQTTLPSEFQFVGNAYENNTQLQDTQTRLPAKKKKKKVNQGIANNALICKPKPVISKPIPGTVWCLVGTSDDRIFFYCPSKQISEWKMPLELNSREDVYQMMADLKKDLENSTFKLTKVNGLPCKEELKVNQSVVTPSENTEIPPPPMEVNTEIPPPPMEVNTEIPPPQMEVNTEIPPQMQVNTEIPPPMEVKSENNVEEVKLNDESNKETAGDNEIKITNELSSWNDITCLKGIDTALAERLAAKERTNLPLKARLQKFQELLVEKNVSAFSTWEKELQKIVFDPRYLLLTSKERKSAFQSFIKKRAVEEAEENAEQIKKDKTKFTQFVDNLLEEHKELCYTEFERKYAKDPRMHLLEKPKDRKLLFMERLKRVERSSAKIRGHSVSSADSRIDRTSNSSRQAELDFKEFLQNSVHHYRCHWDDIYDKFDLRSDRRFSRLLFGEMKEIFQSHCRSLKRRVKNIQGKQRGDDAKKKKHKKSHKGSSRRKRHTETETLKTSSSNLSFSSQEYKSEGEISATEEA